VELDRLLAGSLKVVPPVATARRPAKHLHGSATSTRAARSEPNGQVRASLPSAARRQVGNLDCLDTQEGRAFRLVGVHLRYERLCLLTCREKVDRLPLPVRADDAVHLHPWPLPAATPL
jgi:hypothetical protein